MLQENGNGVLNYCIVDGELIIAGIDNIYGSTENFNFQIFPNPVKQNESFTVTSENEIGNLKLVDIAGKVVFSKKIAANETTIAAPASSGVYVLKRENGKTNKIIVY